MHRVLHFLGIQLPDPQHIAPSIIDTSSHVDVVDESISETSAPAVNPPHITPYSPRLSPISELSVSLVSDRDTARTKYLLQNVDLAVLQKKRRRRKPPVSVIPDDAEYTQPWLSNLGMTEYESKQQRLHDEIVAYTGFVSATPYEVQARGLVLHALEATAKHVFGIASVSLFGSVATDIHLPDADLDVLVITDLPRQLGARSALQQLSSSLRLAQISDDSLVISRAKVPVLTMSTTPQLGSIQVDISMNADIGVKAVETVQKYLNDMPALRPLVLVLKRMLGQCNLDSAATAGLSTYSLVCMVISFLQVNPMQRPIEFIEHPMEFESLGALLLDLLIYYTEMFAYETSRICIESPDGSVLTKPPTTDSFSLSIACLVNPENDIGKPTTKLSHILSAFRDARSRMEKYPFSIEHGNCLGTIIGFPQAFIDRRSLIAELITSGSFEAQIRRCGMNLTSIPPVIYPPQKSKAERKLAESGGSRSTLNDREGNDSRNSRDGSQKRRREDCSDCHPDYYGSRGWVDDTADDHIESESARMVRSGEREWKRTRTRDDTHN